MANLKTRDQRQKIRREYDSFTGKLAVAGKNTIVTMPLAVVH